MTRSLTETEMKLQDAGTQMRLAIANSSDEQTFRSCINAYVALSRSVTMVMECESGNGDLKAWYKATLEQFGQSPLFRFFNSQRVYSIHRGVVEPKINRMKADEASFWYEEEGGKSVLTGTATFSSSSFPVEPADILTMDSAGNMHVWVFDNAKEFLPQDSGNVLRLCQQYFVALKQIVQVWAYRKCNQA